MLTNRNRLKSWLVAGGISFVPLLLPVPARAIAFSHLYAFGDSLSDTGNVSRATAGLFPPHPYRNGRFSNGPIWVDYLGSDLGLTPDHVSSFAFGGSTTGTANTLPIPWLPGLRQEIRQFTATTSTLDPNALYTVWAGSNDYLGTDITTTTRPIQNLTLAIRTLANAGARAILVGNLPDLGRLPSSLNTPRSATLTRLSRSHNTRLTRVLNNLDLTLNPDVELKLLDVNSLFNDAIANPQAYGFGNVRRACLSIQSCVSSPVRQRRFLFWDNVHPTTAAHRHVANLAVDVLSADEAPSDLPVQAITAEAPKILTQAANPTAASVSVPEPASGLGLMSASLAGFALLKRRRNATLPSTGDRPSDRKV